MTRLRTVFTLLVFSALPALGAVYVGAESPLAPPLFGAAPGGHYRPMVASDGADFLALWLDERAGPDYGRTFGSRLSGTDGSITDPAGIALPSNISNLSDLTFGSGRYAAIGSSFVTVGVNGDVATGDAPAGLYPVIASAGDRFLVVRGYDVLKAWFVDEAGHATGGVLDIPADDGFQGTVVPNALTATLDGFVLLYTHGDALLSRGLDASGRATGSAHLLEASSTIDSSGPPLHVAGLASAGTQLLAVWVRRPDWTIVTQRLDAGGDPVRAQNDLHLTNARSPAVVAVGSALLLFHAIGSNLYAQPLDSSGAAAAAAVVVSDCVNGRLDAASNGLRAYVVWEGAEQYAGGSASILGALVDATGHAVNAGDCASRVISRSARGQRSLAMASRVSGYGGSHVAAWIEEGGALSSDRSVMYSVRDEDLRSLRVPEVLDLGAVAAPSVAMNGNFGCFVAWSSSSALKARLVDWYGIASPVFTIANSAVTPATVAAIEVRYVVVWLGVEGWQGEVYSERGAPLARLDREFPLRSVFAPAAPKIACSRDLCLSVWQEAQSTGCFLCFETKVVAARIDRDGHVLDEQPIVLSRTVSGGSGGEIAVASDSDGFLAAWTDEGSRLHAIALSREGQMRGAEAILSDHARDATVVWDGAAYVVAWQSIAGAAARGILATRLRHDGVSLWPYPLNVAPSDEPDAAPVLVPAIDGGLLLGYSRIAFDDYGGVWRAFIRPMSFADRARALRPER